MISITIENPVKLNPGLYLKVEMPHRPAWLYVVEIWSDKFKEKPLAVGSAIRPDLAYRDAVENLKALTHVE